MAKLKSIAFKHRNATHDTMEFLSEATVGQDGTFALTIPDEMAESAGSLAKLVIWNKVTVDKARVNWRVLSTDLAFAQAFIRAAMADHMQVVATRELVIRYRQANAIAYSEAPDGSLHPNGGFLTGSTWQGTLNATTGAALFSVGLAAWVAVKVTNTRGASVKVTYDRPTPEDQAAHPQIVVLNGFVGITKNDPAREMPYSEEAAVFFTDALLAMCQMAKRMTRFFGEPEHLAQSIEQHRARLSNGKQGLLGLDS